MNARQIKDLVIKIYIVDRYGMGDKGEQPPSKAYAQLIIGRRWVDPKEKSEYHIGELLQQIAANMTPEQRINLVVACLQEIRADFTRAVTFSANNIPASLRFYLS